MARSDCVSLRLTAMLQPITTNHMMSWLTRRKDRGHVMYVRGRTGGEGVGGQIWTGRDEEITHGHTRLLFYSSRTLTIDSELDFDRAGPEDSDFEFDVYDSVLCLLSRLLLVSNVPHRRQYRGRDLS